ncbi:MAG: amino acid ABC transporter permease [Actinomycetota bacterium]|nr:amino acid ABC transporter permease [Actinomycetota bacterium]
MEGYRNTLYLVAVAMAASLAIGTAIATVRMAPVPVLPRLAKAEVELFRNTPLVVQMSFFLLGLGSIGIRLSFFAAAAVSLSLYTGAYVTEVVRSGIASVGAGQMDAARSLGMGFGKMMRLVVLPQALRTVVPPMGNLMIAMVKNSAIAAAIGFPELLQQSSIVNSRTFQTFEVFTGTLIGFLSITLPLSYAVSRLEQKLRIVR